MDYFQRNAQSLHGTKMAARFVHNPSEILYDNFPLQTSCRILVASSNDVNEIYVGISESTNSRTKIAFSSGPFLLFLFHTF
jgi:hypothetical protein